ncbi:MAG: 2-dehydro-3-deoxy-D-gluconate 5-dehydrogenase KduD [Lachnospiraceae bacterium]|nr:2-dehydro-3-deoxy-D-gluconate 5-dehydrogenase KduD [Lachnospiraceae bacterium]
MILDDFSLKGKVAVVTGANTGLGQGMCVALAQAGATVAGVARRECTETASLIQKDGGEFTEVLADLSKPESVDLILEKVLSVYGHVDILVNNAGIILREDAINVTAEDWNKVINLNLNMVFLMSQAFARQYIEQGTGGKIVNIASMTSFQGGIRIPAYTSSKSAVLGLTRALANEWASKGINVNAIAPGYMATNNTTQLRDDEKRAGEILERIPAGRWGTPQDVAGAVVFLCSKAADYVHGFTVAVDGGWLAR